MRLYHVSEFTSTTAEKAAQRPVWPQRKTVSGMDHKSPQFDRRTYMQAYRVTEFTSPTPENVATACNAITDMVAKAGAEMIDIVMMDGGKGLVIARYGSEAIMNAATPIHQEAFGVLVADGAIDGSSISSRFGEKVFSF